MFAALVPEMPAVPLKIDGVNQITGQVDLQIRTHGPQTVSIESSTELTPGLWGEVLPPEPNPGEWMPMQIIEATVPEKRFYRAVVE